MSHHRHLCLRAGTGASVRDNEHLSLLAMPYSPFLHSIPHPKSHDHIRCLVLVYRVSALSRPASVIFCLDSFVLAIRRCFFFFFPFNGRKIVGGFLFIKYLANGSLSFESGHT